MLEFLQTGKALSVLAAIGMIGFVSKVITRSLYKRLLKETDNMAMTRNKNLQNLKQRLENTCRLGQNIVNTQAYLDKQIDGFSFLHISLDAWNGVSMEMVLLGLLIGATEAFLAYWYELDASYIVLYASAAVMSGLFLAFIESCFQIDQKQQRLETALLEYVDNSVFLRAAREKETRGQEVSGASGLSGGLAGADSNVREMPKRLQSALRADRAVSGRDGAETDNRDLGETEFEKGKSRTAMRVNPFRERDARAQNLMRAVRTAPREPEERDKHETDGHLTDRRMVSENETGNNTGSRQEAKERPGDKEMEYLKQSLDQIAASRDTRETRSGSTNAGDWMKGLSREEAQVLGDIMREYLSGL